MPKHFSSQENDDCKMHKHSLKMLYIGRFALTGCSVTFLPPGGISWEQDPNLWEPRHGFVFVATLYLPIGFVLFANIVSNEVRWRDI